MAELYIMNPWDWVELVAGCVPYCLIIQKLELIPAVSQASLTGGRYYQKYRPFTATKGVQQIWACAPQRLPCILPRTSDESL